MKKKILSPFFALMFLQLGVLVPSPGKCSEPNPVYRAEFYEESTKYKKVPFPDDSPNHSQFKFNHKARRILDLYNRKNTDSRVILLPYENRIIPFFPDKFALQGITSLTTFSKISGGFEMVQTSSTDFYLRPYSGRTRKRPTPTVFLKLKNIDAFFKKDSTELGNPVTVGVLPRAKWFMTAFATAPDLDFSKVDKVYFERVIQIDSPDKNTNYLYRALCFPSLEFQERAQNINEEGVQESSFDKGSLIHLWLSSESSTIRAQTTTENLMWRGKL